MNSTSRLALATVLNRQVLATRAVPRREVLRELAGADVSNRFLDRDQGGGGARFSDVPPERVARRMARHYRPATAPEVGGWADVEASSVGSTGSTTSHSSSPAWERRRGCCCAVCALAGARARGITPYVGGAKDEERGLTFTEEDSQRVGSHGPPTPLARLGWPKPR